MMSQKGSILVFSEDQNLVFELLAAARPIADKLNLEVGNILLDSKASQIANDYVIYGADVTFLFKNQILETPNPETYLQAIVAVVQQVNPEALLIGGSKRGRELAPRIATRLKTGCAADCISLSVDQDNRIMSTRMVYGGNSNVILVSKNKPLVASVRPKTFERLPKDELRKGRIVNLEIQVGEPRAKVVSIIGAEKGRVNIRNSPIIVTAGRGVKKKEDLSIIEEFASTIGGVVAGSRPLVEDFKWLPKERQVGLSGETVKPSLYVAVGVSGQIHHIVGMKDSRVVVAINSDEAAPIFEACDYGIVGDLYQVIPELSKAFKSMLNKN
jgi:electron transfer flavoprotein alpha subunit